MRIVIDLQCCQFGSKRGGIGRYSIELAKAMARDPRGHDLWVAISGLMPSSNAEIQRAFSGLISPDHIRTFDLPAAIDARRAKPARVRAAELVREDFLHTLTPDFVHVASLFEGLDENIATSVGRIVPGEKTAVTLYDLIPLVQSARYLPNSASRDYYASKIESIENAGLLLAISEYSRMEGLDFLTVQPDNMVNISSAADERFQPTAIAPDKAARVLQRYGIKRKFLMYTASFDERKNQTNLISAFALLPTELRHLYQLVLVGGGSADELRQLKQLAKKSGLEYNEVVFPGHVVDTDLVALYNLCHLFVLPSLAEGFGLPALEAMSCGTATIGSNLTSVPEVIGWSEALFDPTNPDKIAKKIHQALTDKDFLQTLRERGLLQAKKFSWAKTAHRAFDAFEMRAERSKRANANQSKPIDGREKKIFRVTAGLEHVANRIIKLDGALTLSNEDVMEIATAIASNRAQLEGLFAGDSVSED